MHERVIIVILIKMLRFVVAAVLASVLALHGYSKRSLNGSGAIAAFFVGFISFAASYRFGIILILFYYTSSKLTKMKEKVKATLEDDYLKGGNRGIVQVLACSFLGTLSCLLYFYFVGEDSRVNFNDNSSQAVDFIFFSMPKEKAAAYLWSMYIAHYSCAAADTWASEIGILSTSKPRLVTTLLLREVPHGTNGGISFLGTIASMAGGALIGASFCALPLGNDSQLLNNRSQYPMVFVGLLLGFLGSLIDSFLGATVQATYYSFERKSIVKSPGILNEEIGHICGINLLSNEAVNLISIFFTMLLSLWVSPAVFCFCDSNQCIN